MISKHGINSATSNFPVASYFLLRFNTFIPDPSSFHEGHAASSQTMTLSQITSQSSMSLEDEFLQHKMCLTLDDLRSVTKVPAFIDETNIINIYCCILMLKIMYSHMQPRKCIVHATIQCLAKRYKWWYSGCTQEKCSKRVVAEGDMWYCEKCDRRWGSSSPM